MTYEQIVDTLQKRNSLELLFEIRFKTREPIKGLFIKTSDFRELSRKNLWRIVSEKHIEEYKRTKNENLARLFNGLEFKKLEPQQ